jgi:hypothetical protein
VFGADGARLMTTTDLVGTSSVYAFAVAVRVARWLAVDEATIHGHFNR